MMGDYKFSEKKLLDKNSGAKEPHLLYPDQHYKWRDAVT